MNYYIDFDNTLYNTPLLLEKLLECITNIICNEKKLYHLDVLNECKEMFGKDKINNIYELSEYFANKYNIDPTKIIAKVNDIILNGESFVFEDVKPFLEKLCQKNNLYLLTHSIDNKYQANKISGSGIANYFDAIIITNNPKYELDIDYSNGIFIDDNPDDLLGLYNKKANKVIRLRRKENKYSSKDLDIHIEEYTDFNSIKIT